MQNPILTLNFEPSTFHLLINKWGEIIEEKGQKSVLINLKLNGAYYFDDLLLWLESFENLDFQFALEITPEDLESYPENRNRFFHLSGFFDYLAKRIISDPGQKAFYIQLSRQLGGAEGSIHAGMFILPKTKLVSSGQFMNKELRKLLRPLKTVSKKIIHSFKKEQGLEKINAVAKPNPADWQKVLITGWYGTETTGDKAIIGEIIYALRQYNPDLKVIVTSIDWKVSYQTSVEMCMEDIEIIGINNAYAPELIEKVDAVIMGGGPLMESRQIQNIWRMFLEANTQQKARIIFGCGVGPIHTEEIRQKIGDILKVSTAGFFRDAPSKEYALSIGADTGFPVACDPALAYVDRWRIQNLPQKQDSSEFEIKGLLREQTKEYFQGGQLNNRIDAFVQSISTCLNQFLEKYPDSHLDLMPMHMYWKGNDDRIFNRKLVTEINSSRFNLVREYLDLDKLLGQLNQGHLSLAMRYHGHLFCLALGIPFLSIDYTGKGGKISNLLQRIDYENFSESFSMFSAESAVHKMEFLKENQATISQNLLMHSSRLLTGLQKAYEYNWQEVKTPV